MSCTEAHRHIYLNYTTKRPNDLGIHNYVQNISKQGYLLILLLSLCLAVWYCFLAPLVVATGFVIPYPFYLSCLTAFVCLIWLIDFLCLLSSSFHFSFFLSIFLLLISSCFKLSVVVSSVYSLATVFLQLSLLCLSCVNSFSRLSSWHG